MATRNLINERCHTLPAGAVQFLGRVSDAELVHQYRTHNLLAVPSYEGFGIVYLEAMRFGLPVIASTLGAAREIVTNGENGFFVRPHDTHTFVAAPAVAARQSRTAPGHELRRPPALYPTPNLAAKHGRRCRLAYCPAGKLVARGREN